jgi:hypothetical protein
MVKKWDENNLLDTHKKHSQFYKCGILNLETSKYVHWKIQNFKTPKVFY